MKKITFIKLVITSLCLLLSTMLLAQENLYKIPLQQQIQESTQIIEGKVISQNSFWDDQELNIYTINTVSIYKVFKGQELETIEVITPGGTVGLVAQTVSPSLKLSIGDIGVFTLMNSTTQIPNSNSGKFKPYSGIQGFYKYNIFNNTAVNPFTVRSDISTLFYNEIMDLTHTNYIDVTLFNLNEFIEGNTNRASRGATSITSFSPTTATSGTKTIITINGTDFLNTQQNVGFLNANSGGGGYTIAQQTQIISWSDTQIQVEVPSAAGNGSIAIINEPPTAVLATSAQTLTVPYATSNVLSDPDDDSGSGGSNGPLGIYAYPNSHYNINGSGGYTWQMQTDFNANASANQSFVRAFNTWRCETGVNWSIGPVTTTDTAGNDGINIIRFDNGGELDAGVLGVCSTVSAGCRLGGAEMEWLVIDLDIVFDDGVNWQFGPANAVDPQIDFETVAVHELGHGHQLGHVIDSNKIMHFSLGAGDNNRVLSSSDIDGGNYMQNRSTTLMPCGVGSMTDFDCSTLSTEDFILSEGVTIYPIPAYENLYINNGSSEILETATLYDVNGRFVFEKIISAENSLTRLDVSKLSQGIYFVKIQSENNAFTKRIIIK